MSPSVTSFVSHILLQRAGQPARRPPWSRAQPEPGIGLSECKGRSDGDTKEKGDGNGLLQFHVPAECGPASSTGSPRMTRIGTTAIRGMSTRPARPGPALAYPLVSPPQLQKHFPPFPLSAVIVATCNRIPHTAPRT